jgi:predicted oxidoreductase
MQRIELAAHGPQFSRMVYGTWRLLDNEPTAQQINRRIHDCLELGITTIDTAEIYGLYEVEQRLGAALALTPGLRDQLEIVTKAGIYVPCAYHPERRTAHYNATGPRLVKSLEKSLRFLGTDRVELFLVHRPDWLTRADDTAAGFNELLRAGKIRAAGVSNFSASQFDLLNSHMIQPLVTNQIEFHLLHDEPINDGTLHQCEKLGVRPMAWSPLAGGEKYVTPLQRGHARAACLCLDSGEPESSVASHRHDQTRTFAIRGAGRCNRIGARRLVRALGSCARPQRSVNTLNTIRSENLNFGHR